MSTRSRIALVAPALAAVTVLLLSACSGGTAGGGSGAAPSAPAAAGEGQQRTQGGAAADPQRSGTSGQIASVTGTVMQLRGTDSQTAVAWTSTTTFTSEVAGSLSDVTVGSCVLAVAVPSATASGGTTATPDASASIAATTVRITPAAADGTCAAGFGGGFRGGQRPNGAPTGAPTDAPNGTRPSGAPGAGQFRGFGGVASGKVTAVSGSTLTVDAVGPNNATTSRTVTVSAATTYTSTKTADATAVVVGQCATARGKADASGKVTATSVTVSAPTDGSCSTGFGGFGGGGFGGGRGPGGNTTGGQGGGTNA